MYLGHKDQNCMVLFLIMKKTDRVLLTAMASYDCCEDTPIVLFLAEKVACTVLHNEFTIRFPKSF